MFSYKDSLKKMIRSEIAYRNTCSNCKVTYYGRTYHHFFSRATEHIGISNLTWKHLKSVKQSAVSNHLFECHCSIDHYVQKIWTTFYRQLPLYGHCPFLSFFQTPCFFTKFFRQYCPKEIPDKHKSKIMWQCYFFSFRRLIWLFYKK